MTARCSSRGPNRFVGYWQNPEATAAAIDADGWYHTGDLGELSADGFLTLRGRKKDMIALADGQKVYPDDVEAVLVGDDRIRDAAVVGLDGDGGGVRVHAVLLADDASVAEAVVRDANARLAGHQQIRGWSVWPDEDFPRTPSMKVKKRLVLAALERGDGAASATARPRRPATARRPRRGDARWRPWPGSSPRWPRFRRRRSLRARASRPISASTRSAASSC